MKVTDVIESWNSFSNFVIERVSGVNSEDLTQAEIDEINEASVKLVKDVDIGSIIPKAKKLANLNILDKKVNFKELEKFPYFWYTIYPVEIDVVAAECGQAVMARA